MKFELKPERNIGMAKYEYPPHLRERRNARRNMAYRTNKEYRDNVRAMNRANYERKRAAALQQGEKSIRFALTNETEIANICKLRDVFTFMIDADGNVSKKNIGMLYCANTHELAEIIGYSHITVTRWLLDGIFPEPNYWTADSMSFLFEHVVEIARLFNEHQVNVSTYYNRNHNLYNKLMAIDLAKFTS